MTLMKPYKGINYKAKTKVKQGAGRGARPCASPEGRVFYKI